MKERKKKCPHIGEFDTTAMNICLRYPVFGHFFLCDTDDCRESLNIRAHDQNERVECVMSMRCIGVR